MAKDNTPTIRFNSKGEVTLPFHQVGGPDIDLAKTYEAVTKAQKAQSKSA